MANIIKNRHVLPLQIKKDRRFWKAVYLLLLTRKDMRHIWKQLVRLTRLNDVRLKFSQLLKLGNLYRRWNRIKEKGWTRYFEMITQSWITTDNYKLLCSLDQVKGLDTGNRYIHNKAAPKFVQSIAKVEREKTVDMIRKVEFFSFMMNWSTDISGDDREALYLRLSINGQVVERFWGLGTPRSTCSQNLKEFGLNMFGNLGIDRDISIYCYF